MAPGQGFGTHGHRDMEIISGYLKRVLAPWITARLTLVAAFPSRKYMPSRTRAFMDCLIEHSRKTIQGLGIDVPQP